MRPRFKLDENADPRWSEPLGNAGYDALTVAEQALGGCRDHGLAHVCRGEERCLVKLDLGFAQVLEFPPENYAGIVVLRNPRPTLGAMMDLVRMLVAVLETRSPRGELWILEPGRIRIHGART